MGLRNRKDEEEHGPDCPCNACYRSRASAKVWGCGEDEFVRNGTDLTGFTSSENRNDSGFHR